MFECHTAGSRLLRLYVSTCYHLILCTLNIAFITREGKLYTMACFVYIPGLMYYAVQGSGF